MAGLFSRQLHREEGFSVFEVVLAAFILFFVLTAMLGLVGTTTRMNLTARATNAVTNAVSTHVEWVRSLEFEQVGIRGSTVEAVLEPEYTYSVEGYTITIQNQVRIAADGTKELIITANASRDGFNGTTMTTFAAIRDKDEGLTTIVDTTKLPVLEFGSSSPPEDEVVFGSYRVGGSPLYIEAHSEAKHPGGYIADLRFYCSGELLRDGNTIFAEVASWQPGTSPVNQLFRWDTRQVDDDGQAVIQDGWRLVRLIAIDDQGNQATKDRRLYVDNYAPNKPGTPSARIYDNSEVRLSWSEAMDGTDAAIKYEVQISQVLSDGSLAPAKSSLINVPAHLFYGSSFSRYANKVRAGSPRNLWSAYVDLPVPFTTRPLLTGTSNTTYTGRNNLRTSHTDVKLSVTPPSFGTSSLRYDLYRSMDPANMGGTPYKSDIGPTFNETIVKTVGKFGSPDPWYYQYKITYTALGPGGGASETILSNVSGPISMEGEQVMAVTW